VIRRPPAALAAFALAVSLTLVTVAPAFAFGPVSVPSPPGSPAFAPAWAGSTQDLSAPDPDVVRFGNRYYAYTTGTSWGNHIGVLQSSSPNRGFNTVSGKSYGSSAFPQIPAGQSVRPWQVNSSQNAPGVFKIGGRYVMYYTAQTTSGHGGHYCLSRATSSSPAGPFTDNSSAPWMCMDAQGGAIDPSPFVDAAGRAWLYFKTYDLVERGSEPAQIYAVRLTANGLTAASGPTSVLAQSSLSSSFETVENPQMLNVSGTLMLLYSRGGWTTSGYRQGYATCASPAGPCHEGQDAFLTSYGNVRGPGGGSIFTDTGGRHWLAYQGWNGSPGCTGAQGAACARKLYVGTLNLGSVRPPVHCRASVPINGYRLVASDGGIFSFGNQQFCGSTGNIALNKPIIGMARTANGGGYWLLASDGGMFAFGNAHFYGSAGGSHAAQPFVDMVATPSGHGYWLANANGSVYSYGDAKSYGSAVGKHLSSPVAAMTATTSGHGYWLATRAGRVIPFGDARALGSTGALNQPILDMARTQSGKGYWLLGSDGGIFTFGDAHFYGSTGGIHLNQPIVGMETTPRGKGYWLVARDGGIFTFGDAHFRGSTGGIHLNQPIVGMA
jgi:Glycosyl hydrolases family 43